MRRISLHICIVLLTFVSGVFVNSLVLQYFPSHVATVDSWALRSETKDRFVAAGSLREPDYHIYWYRRATSNDPEEITLYGDFRSAQVTHEHFESNATTDADRLIERGSKFDENGKEIGKRGVTSFKDVHAVRIFWTDGDTFWFVQAPTLELAREFEKSAIVHAITMSNKRLQQNRR